MDCSILRIEWPGKILGKIILENIWVYVIMLVWNVSLVGLYTHVAGNVKISFSRVYYEHYLLYVRKKEVKWLGLTLFTIYKKKGVNN